MDPKFDLSALLKPGFLGAVCALIPASILLVGVWRFRPEIARLYFDSQASSQWILSVAFCGAIYAGGLAIQLFASAIGFVAYAIGYFLGFRLIRKYPSVAGWNEVGFRKLASEVLQQSGPSALSTQPLTVDQAIDLLVTQAGVEAENIDKAKAALREQALSKIVEFARAMTDYAKTQLDAEWRDWFDAFADLVAIDWNNIMTGLEFMAVPISTFAAIFVLGFLGQIADVWFYLSLAAGIGALAMILGIGFLFCWYYLSATRIKSGLLRQLRSANTPIGQE